jgi:hypothetical protein
MFASVHKVGETAIFNWHFFKNKEALNSLLNNPISTTTLKIYTKILSLK